MKKKIISLLLALALMVGICPTAFAADENNIDGEIQNQMIRILTSIEKEKEEFGLADVDFAEVQVGREILTYRIIDGEIFPNNLRLFPILHEGQLRSFFYVTDTPDNELYVQLSSELVSSIAPYTNAAPFALVYDASGVYLYSEGEFYQLGNTEGHLGIVENDKSTEQLTYTEKHKISTAGLSICLTLNATSVDTSQSSRGIISAYLPVKIIKQPEGTNICWAISVASIVNYVFDNDVSYESIVYYFTDGEDRGLDTEDIIWNLNRWFHTTWDYELTNKMKPDLAVDYLALDYPLLGGFTSSHGSHSVVIRGANSEKRTFSIMNPTPTTTDYTAGTISSTNIWRFVSGYSGLSYTMSSYGYPLLSGPEY